MKSSGFTLIEVLIALSIMTMSLVFVTYFTLDVSTFGTDLNSRLEAEFELQITLRSMISEIRSMGPGDNGAYPIAVATATTFTFYSDIDGDGTFEQLRYFLDGTILKRGITHPTTTEPVLYPAADEVITEVVHNLTSGTIFTYYPEGLPGETPALASPIDVSKIRLVSIEGTVDQDTSKPPLPSTLSISVTIRNLRGEI
jgi:prepilin-type N-terminal cleavage/methylation domain-containing protein